MGSDNAVLVAGDVTAQVNPDGARLESLVVHGHELIVPLDAEGPIFSGAFPMIPWCGLVRDARLDVDGQEVALAADWDVHALHGVVKDAAWTVDEANPEAVALAVDLPDAWPFGGRASARFALTGHSLAITWTVEAGAQDMPAAIGWHPWFTRRVASADLEVGQGFTAQWARSADGVPLDAWKPVAPPPWDDSFLASAPVTLTWGDAVQLTLRGSGGVYSVYDGRELGVVVAAQTSPHERLGHRLQPGAALSLAVELAWGEPEGTPSHE